MTTATQVEGMEHASFEVVPTNAALGAEVRSIDLKTIDAPVFARLHQAWLEHVLLVFRGQSLGAGDLVRLVHFFGTPVTSSNLHQRNLEERIANQLFDLPPEVTVVSNLKEDGKPIGIQLPNSLVLEIVETNPVMKSATKTASSKPAKLENGVTVNVPEFISTGERIRVNPQTGEYLDRAKD